MKSKTEKLVAKHPEVTFSEAKKVTSHVQREEGDWSLNTLMIEGYDVPFKYRRKKKYKNLKGAYVNLSYYPLTESVSGLEFEIMKVVKINLT
ncbi:MAG: hypothetical protein JKY67_22005 [Pseudomonadales bacterium]|nr:hypothetical protein [Pseudomonadales bacterium]